MKKIRLHTETYFDSAHRLVGYDGKCIKMHGHTWKVQLWIEGYGKDIDSVGIMFDFGILKQLCEKFDHKILNEMEYFRYKNPTAENISITIFDLMKKIKPNLDFCVRIYETSVGKTTWAEYGDFYI